LNGEMFWKWRIVCISGMRVITTSLAMIGRQFWMMIVGRRYGKIGRIVKIERTMRLDVFILFHSYRLHDCTILSVPYYCRSTSRMNKPFFGTVFFFISAKNQNMRFILKINNFLAV